MTQRVTNSGRLVRIVAALACAALLAGCASTPDWANPVEWYKSAKSAVTGDDSATEKAREEAKAKEKNSPGADKKYPNLASVPDRPKDISANDGTKVEQGLVADRTEARHAALGPGDNAMAPMGGDTGSSASSSPSSAPEPVIASPPPPPSRASAARVEAPPVTPPAPYAPSASASPPRASQSQPEPQPMAQAPAGGGTPASEQMASLEPAAPVIPPSSDSSDGVRQAFEEALSQQSAPMVGNATAGVRDVHASAVPMETRHNTMPVPPELGSGITLRAPESAQTASIDSTFGTVGAGASEVGAVFFGNGSSKLSGQSITELKNIANLYKQKGGKVRVVGHASSRTRNTDPLRHQLANFRVSLARANAVARQLTRLGVPADKIAVTAVADNEPVYYEFMPKGEAGNRRAEIFLDY